MNIRQFRVSRRSVTILTVLIGTVSLAIGAHAALYKRAAETTKAVAVSAAGDSVKGAAKLALVIGNGHYPDANAPLTQSINDARALSAALRGDAFDVAVIEDATRDDITRAHPRCK